MCYDGRDSSAKNNLCLGFQRDPALPLSLLSIYQNTMHLLLSNYPSVPFLPSSPHYSHPRPPPLCSWRPFSRSLVKQIIPLSNCVSKPPHLVERPSGASRERGNGPKNSGKGQSRVCEGMSLSGTKWQPPPRPVRSGHGTEKQIGGLRKRVTLL